jgi:hypothetical protein
LGAIFFPRRKSRHVAEAGGLLFRRPLVCANLFRQPPSSLKPQDQLQSGATLAMPGGMEMRSSVDGTEKSYPSK